MTRTAVEPGSVGTPERRGPKPVGEHEGLTPVVYVWKDHGLLMMAAAHEPHPGRAEPLYDATTIRTQAAELERLRAVRDALLEAGGACPTTGLFRFAYWNLDRLNKAFDLAARALSDTPPEKNGTPREG